MKIIIIIIMILVINYLSYQSHIHNHGGGGRGRGRERERQNGRYCGFTSWLFLHVSVSRLNEMRGVIFSVFNEESYSVGWMDGWMYICTQHPYVILFTCPFLWDFCPYNQGQTFKFFTDEINIPVFLSYLDKRAKSLDGHYLHDNRHFRKVIQKKEGSQEHLTMQYLIRLNLQTYMQRHPLLSRKTNTSKRHN